MTRDLTVELEAIEQRIRAARAEEGARKREEFLAILGHELRNPLAPMLTALHVIKLRRGVGCERELGVLERQLVHLSHLLEDLSDVAGALRDKVHLSRRTTTMQEVLANAVEISSPRIEQRRHRLVMDTPDQRLFVNVDADRMTQVLVNLLNNAAKYTDPGGEIRVRAVGKDDEVEVTVEDTGIGIEPELLGHVFELFTQGRPAVKGAVGGFGIGLAVARRLVEAHGGTLTAHSAGAGKGSRFTVRLPREAVARVDSSSEIRVLSTGGPRRVLIVEDNEDSADMMRVLFEQLGHEVAVALDGPRGLELAHEFKPDIAFLDLGLPGMSGLELVGRMRKIPTCAEIPIVAVSGYTRDRDRQEAIRAGFSEHMAKPFDLSRLQQVVSGRDG